MLERKEKKEREGGDVNREGVLRVCVRVCVKVEERDGELVNLCGGGGSSSPG